MPPAENVTGLVLSGGGARAAYQVGAMRAIAKLLPRKQAPALPHHLRHLGRRDQCGAAGVECRLVPARRGAARALVAQDRRHRRLSRRLAHACAPRACASSAASAAAATDRAGAARCSTTRRSPRCCGAGIDLSRVAAHIEVGTSARARHQRDELRHRPRRHLLRSGRDGSPSGGGRAAAASAAGSPSST